MGAIASQKTGLAIVDSTAFQTQIKENIKAQLIPVHVVQLRVFRGTNRSPWEKKIVAAS